MEGRLVRMSKFLSYVLRHHPEAEGLTMDDHGWVGVEELLSAPGAKQRGITRDLLSQVVAENDKQRFEFDEARQKVRAQQGHSRAVEMDWAVAIPPEYLYHGTAEQAVSRIREEGLLKQSRQHVHLCLDHGTAMKVGARHGRPVVLAIRAREMHATGHKFYVSGNGIWLTENVPPQFIDFP